MLIQLKGRSLKVVQELCEYELERILAVISRAAFLDIERKTVCPILILHTLTLKRMLQIISSIQSLAPSAH